MSKIGYIKQLKKEIILSINDWKKRKLTTGEQRKMVRGYKKRIKELSLIEQHNLALSLYRQKDSDTAMFATSIINWNIDQLKLSNLKWLNSYSSNLADWGQTDDFCLNVVQPLLLKYPKEIIKILSKWNKSKNMWERRASMVTFVRTIRESGKFTDVCLKLCNNLLNDPERLVKQGVGWAIKDNLRGNKKKVLRYIKKLRKSGVSSIITLYAIRDLKGKEREEVLSL